MGAGAILNLVSLGLAIGLLLFSCRRHVPSLPPIGATDRAEAIALDNSVREKLISPLRRREAQRTAILTLSLGLAVIAIVAGENLWRGLFEIEESVRTVHLRLLPSLFPDAFTSFEPVVWVLLSILLLAVVALRGLSSTCRRGRALVQYFRNNEGDREVDDFFLTWVWNERSSLPPVAGESLHPAVRKAVIDVWRGRWSSAQQPIASVLGRDCDADENARERFTKFAPVSAAFWVTLIYAGLGVLLIWLGLQLRFMTL